LRKHIFDGDISTSFTRKFTNIRNALVTIQDKSSDVLWSDLPKTKLKKHLVNGSLIDPVVSISFYSVQVLEENRLFGISFTTSGAVPEK